MNDSIDNIDSNATDQSLLWADPADLVVGENVRLDSRVDRPFVASIRERGVLEPIVAYRDDDRALIVLYGQRRTLGAVQAGRTTVPVHLVPRPSEADRLVDQVSENDHRAGLSTAERVAAYEQMTALGLTAGQIAKRTARKRGDVDAALTVAGSPLAKGAAARWDFLTLTQAATLAEFDGNPEAAKALVSAAKTGQFEHVAQRLRDDQAEAEARAAVADALTEAGVSIIDRPDYASPVLPLTRLRDSDGERITPESHASCPGHAAYLDAEWIYADLDDSQDEDGGEDDEDFEDLDEDGDQGGQPRRGPTKAWRATYVCRDPKANGHTDSWSSPSSSTRKTAAEMTGAEREEARAARRDVIESNKAWDSAQTVRRTWLRAWLARKSAPKGTATFLATALAVDPEVVIDIEGNGLAAGWFGCDQDTYGRSTALAAAVTDAGDARAQVIGLGIVLAGYEAHTSRDSWRSVNPGTARYLAFLAANGYDLAPVELRAAGEQQPEADGDQG